MYATVEQKPIQKTSGDKPANKRPSWSLLFLFPTILLILVLGASMGTVIGFKSQLKSIEDRIVLMEESMTLIMDFSQKNQDVFKERTADLKAGQAESAEGVNIPVKTVKKDYPAESPRRAKASGKIPQKQYRTASSGTTVNSINAPL